MNKQHILIINRYFYPDISSVPQLLTELSEDLIKEGYKISVLCSRNNYNGKKKHSRYERYKNINIFRVNNIYGRNRGILKRLLEIVTFFFLIFMKGIKIKKVDMIITLSSPPLLSFIGLILARLKKTKTIHIVEDLHPNLAVALGFLKSGSFIYRFSLKLNRYIFNYSNKIIVLGRFMRNRIEKDYSIESNKIIEISNWADGARIKPLDKSKNHLIKKWNLENIFIIQYSGNMGLGHNFDTILDGINQLKSRDDIHFVFIGDGPKRREIDNSIKNMNLTSITLLPYQPYEDLIFSLGACDISLVSFSKEVEGLMVPSKIYGILAAGKPFILIGGQNNEIADICRSNNIGKIVEENDTDGFVNAVLYYKNNPKHILRESIITRRLFEENYDRKISVSKYIKTIEELL